MLPFETSCWLTSAQVLAEKAQHILSEKVEVLLAATGGYGGPSVFSLESA